MIRRRPVGGHPGEKWYVVVRYIGPLGKVLEVKLTGFDSNVEARVAGIALLESLGNYHGMLWCGLTDRLAAYMDRDSCKATVFTGTA